VRFLKLSEVLELHRQIISQTGGSMGILHLGGLESALAQPRMTFAGSDLYPTIAEKASALGYSLIQNHPFIDGNKRTGHAAMEVFLVLNGLEILAPLSEQEEVILQLAPGEMERDGFTTWLQTHLKKIQ
jgi:death-on-curing protein